MNPEIKIAEPQLSGAALPVETPDLLAREEEVSGRAFRGGDISGLACDHLAVTSCSFTGCRLSGVVWRHAHLADVVFRNCDLSVADLTGAGLFRVRFIDCRLSGASLSEASLQHVAAERCHAEYAGFAQSRMRHVRFAGCDLSGGALRSVVSSRLPFPNAALPMRSSSEPGCAVSLWPIRIFAASEFTKSLLSS